jgi:hypothetical protein
VERIRVEQHSLGGLLWVVGWFFTIGFLHLAWWPAIKAVVLWPYYLGLVLSALAHL